MRASAWLFPTAEILHIVAFVVALGCLLVLDFRLIGLGRRIAFNEVAGALLPWAIGAFCLTIPTGILLLLPEASSVGHNPAFLVKLTLVVLAGANAGLFHLGPWRRRDRWPVGVPPMSARISGTISILLWVGVIAAGRLIAYL
ncbi:MAG TPA: hypothetical protein VFZ03_00175 [Dongiaceae bacterium]